MKRPSVRAALIAILEVHVEKLVAANRVHDLDDVLDSTGFTQICLMTSKQIGRAILALAPVLTRHYLENAAHVSVFRYHSPRDGEGKPWDEGDGIADRALRDAGVDVDARNAKLEADARRVEAQVAA